MVRKMIKSLSSLSFLLIMSKVLETLKLVSEILTSTCWFDWFISFMHRLCSIAFAISVKLLRCDRTLTIEKASSSTKFIFSQISNTLCFSKSMSFMNLVLCSMNRMRLSNSKATGFYIYSMLSSGTFFSSDLNSLYFISGITMIWLSSVSNCSF